MHWELIGVGHMQEEDWQPVHDHQTRGYFEK